jgi:hypothetical protein
MPGSLAGGAAARAYAAAATDAAIAAKRIARSVDSLLVIGRHPRDVEH